MKYTSICLSLISFTCFGMQLSSQENEQKNDKEVTHIVAEINEANRAKNEQLAMLIYHAPFAKKINVEDYYILEKLCKPKNAKLLDRLIKKGIVDPNSYLQLGQKRVGLLADAICFVEPRCVSFKLFNGDRYAAIKVLLAAKADPNQELYARTVLSYEGSPVTALSRALRYDNSEVAVLILQYNADPNLADKDGITPLMYAIRNWGSICGPEKLRTYEIVRALLKHGARIDMPSATWSDQLITTPMRYAQEKKFKDLIALFKEYAHLDNLKK